MIDHIEAIAFLRGWLSPEGKEYPGIRAIWRSELDSALCIVGFVHLSSFREVDDTGGIERLFCR